MASKQVKIKEMNDYLKDAFNKLNSEDLQNLILWLLEKKTITYISMQKDVDFENNLIFLNELEEKLRIIYANIIQREDKE